MKIGNLADFARYAALSPSDRERIHTQEMSGPDRQRMGELQAFHGFVRVTGLPIDAASVRCCKPKLPDIECVLGSAPYFFELGEVVDQGLARDYALSQRTGQSNGVSCSEAEALEYMITSKAKKTYQTGGVPVDLLLYYWKQHPYDPVIEQTLTRLRR